MVAMCFFWVSWPAQACAGFVGHERAWSRMPIVALLGGAGKLRSNRIKQLSDAAVIFIQ